VEPPTAAAQTTTTTGAVSTPTRSSVPNGGALERLPTMTASVDDNRAFPAYLDYRRSAEALGIRFLPIDVDRRRVITVHDPAGTPVLGANVAVTDPAGAIVGLMKTYADGRALFVPPTGAAPGVTYNVSATKAGVTASVPLPPATDEVAVTLAAPAAPVDLDVLFLLDGTGSMDEEIQQLQQGIGPLTAQLRTLAAGGTVQFGLTVYRDRDDLFRTRTFNFTPDAAAFGQALAEVQVGGGGDTPEDVGAGLHDALTKPSWRFGETVKLLFLVGDAPPHLDYPDSTPYAESVTNAVQQGVKIMTIGASGLGDQGEYVFRQLAQTTMGRFVFLTSGSTGVRPVQGRSHLITADDYSALPLDELVLRLAREEVASHG